MGESRGCAAGRVAVEEDLHGQGGGGAGYRECVPGEAVVSGFGDEKGRAVRGCLR